MYGTPRDQQQHTAADETAAHSTPMAKRPRKAGGRPNPIRQNGSEACLEEPLGCTEPIQVFGLEFFGSICASQYVKAASRVKL